MRKLNLVDPKELFEGMNNETLRETTQAALEVAAERGLAVSGALGTMAANATGQEVPSETEIGIKEQLSSQLPVTFAGYNTIVDQIAYMRGKIDFDTLTPKGLPINFEAWLTEDKLAYVEDAMKADPDLRFTLVAVPNILVSVEEISELARNFGKDQPHETYIVKELYSEYTPEELSGTDPESFNNQEVIFSLIPNKLNTNLSGTVAEQNTALTELKTSHPFLKVPSLLEAVTYWQTLRANGDKLNESADFYKTYVRHFDMDSKRLDGWFLVPYSGTDRRGVPGLSDSGVGVSDGARLAVG